jgi:hypothetical protein
VKGKLWASAGCEHPLLERPKTDHVVGRLDADPHLVAVVGIVVRQPCSIEPTSPNSTVFGSAIARW